MSLAERLAKPPVDTRQQFCRVGIMLVNLPDLNERTALAAALSTPGWTAVQIEEALAAEGHEVSRRHIRDHRRGVHSETECAAHTVGVLRPARNQGDY